MTVRHVRNLYRKLRPWKGLGAPVHHKKDIGSELIIKPFGPTPQKTVNRVMMSHRRKKIKVSLAPVSSLKED